MTKRRTQRDIDELSDEVLADLTPTERVQVALEATACDRPEWHERLAETCPTETYRMPDQAYRRRLQWVADIGRQAVYELHTQLLAFRLLYQHRRETDIVATLRDVEIAPDEAMPDERPLERLATLSISYYGYERFADEVLDCALETWLAEHPNGPALVDAVEDVLAEHGTCREKLAHEVFPDDDDGEDDVTIGGMATTLAATLALEWEDLPGR